MASGIVGLAGLLILSASPASALTLTLLYDGRSVAAGCAESCSTEAVPDAPFAPWSISLSGASQVSSIDLLGMGGGGDALSSSINDAASSIFYVMFSIDEAALFSLTGSVGAGGTEEHTPTGRFSAANVSLSDETGVDPLVRWAVSSSMSGSEQAFDHEGYLPPAIYTMWAYADGAGVSAGWNFELGLAPVSEPSAGLLIAAGLLGLALRRTSR